MKFNKWYLCLIIIIFIAIYGFLYSSLPLHLVWERTTIAGGDTGSHNYIAYYSSKIFPKIKWWSPDWYAGFPFLYFYPPFLYYLVAAGSYLFSGILPWMRGLKIVTLWGTFLLPLAVFLAFKILRFRFPLPSIAALFSLLYLFLEKFSTYGANLPSTLAGEFSYSFAFALFFVFIALLFKGLEEKKYLRENILLLSVIVLSHPFAVIMAILVAIFYLFVYFYWNRKNFWEKFKYLVKLFGFAFCLTAFWSLPFLTYLPYTAKMSWNRVVKIEELFPPKIIFWEILGLAGIVLGLIKKEKKILPFIATLAVGLIPYLALNHSSIWNTRFLPYLIFSLLMLAAYFVGESFNLLTSLRKIVSCKYLKEVLLTLLILSLTCFLIKRQLPSQISYIPHWFQWNYEGFENKEYWSELHQLMSYLHSLPPGGIMWEYRPEYDKFGTTRVLEDIPIWTEHPTYEGLLIESGLSSYFHFINQAETTKTPTAAVAGFKYPPFNFVRGVKHLQLFGARYFVAFTPEIKKLADEHLMKLKQFEEFSVYKIPNSSLVDILSSWRLQKKNKNWVEKSIEWYKGEELEKPIIFYRNKRELNQILQILSQGKRENNSNEIRVLKWEKDKVVFNTSALHQPHLIKISYFPGWKVEGALGPYLVTPSFMVVIPYSNKIILSYHYPFWDNVGIMFSLISFFTLLASFFFQKLKNLFIAQESRTEGP